MSAKAESKPRAAFLEEFPGASDPLAVAMLYNRNVMATWCWEAAHALHELGRSVILIAAADVPLPGTPEVEVVRVDMAGKPAERGRQAWDRAQNLLFGLHLAARSWLPSNPQPSSGDLATSSGVK